MKEICTPNSLVRLLYNETSLSEEFNLSGQINGNAALKATYESLQEAKQALPKVQFNPSQSVIDRIMAYSRETAPEHHC